MLNTEEILIKIMQLLDFDMKEIKLKQSSEKNRFFTNEEEYSYQYAWDKRKYKDKMVYPIVDDEEEVFGSKQQIFQNYEKNDLV